MWTYGVNNNRQILICNPKANDTQTCLTWNSYPYVANNSTWHTSIFDMKQLSMCGKQQEMTYNHVWHETVIHMWQTTANDTQTFLSWSSCPYVANNSKWHTSIFDMKQLSICGKQQQMTYNHFDMKQLSICGKQQQMTHKHLWHETVVHMWQTTANDTQACLTWNSYPYVANNSKWHTSIFDMKQLSICGKQQQMTHKHVWHETVIHMWQTTANDTQAFLTWNSYPYVATTANDTQSCLTWNSWHTSIFPSMWQTTANDTQACLTWNSYPYVANNSKHFWHETQQTTANDIQSCLTWNSYPCDTQACFTWNSYPYVANNSKWHTNMFAMKQLSICGKQQHMKQLSIQTTANDTQTCLPWNSYPSVANNSKWHRSIFDMKQLSICSKQQQMTHKHVWHETAIHMWQTTANDIQACLAWNSYPCMSNNSKWHTRIFDMKRLSMFYLFIYL